MTLVNITASKELLVITLTIVMEGVSGISVALDIPTAGKLHQCAKGYNVERVGVCTRTDPIALRGMAKMCQEIAQG